MSMRTLREIITAAKAGAPTTPEESRAALLAQAALLEAMTKALAALVDRRPAAHPDNEALLQALHREGARVALDRARAAQDAVPPPPPVARPPGGVAP